MGVFHAQGRDAAAFLNAVTTNDVLKLKVGMSHYTFLLDVDGQPFDDLLIYRLGADEFFIVVNASNNDKNWAWLNAVKNGSVMVDKAYPGRVIPATEFVLRDLRAETSGSDRRVDLALQGPESLRILQAMGGETDKVAALPWAGITRATIGGFDLIVSRTGYTGERIAFELFPHPDASAALFQALVDHGAVPCGLASRDSLRIEAGLPLYGHELAGDLRLNPADAGMGNYVKTNKPFFVGKTAYLAHEALRDGEIIRFRFNDKAGRMAHPGDLVTDSSGAQVGTVTSCSRDTEGYRLGQAYVKTGHRKVGNTLYIAAGASEGKSAESKPVTVLSRFPERR